MLRRPESLFAGIVAVAAAAAGSAVLLRGAAQGDPGSDTGSGGYSPRVGPPFVNWETPPVHPVDMTPDRSKLLLAQTADNRLLVFGLASGSPVLTGSVPVGLDPVTVRSRTNAEVWVVNKISDTVSIVNLSTMNVVRTLSTADEPCDVVFAGSPQKAYVSCGAAHVVQVFDPANPGAAPTSIAIDAEDPRSLAVSPDGLTVYAGIYMSGNRSTILGGGASGMGTVGFPPNAVGDAAGPYGGTNPPPNVGTTFSPAFSAGLPTPPRVGLIVKKNAAGQWMDDNAHDWTSMVSGANASRSGRVTGWDLPDRDLAVISTATNSVNYATTLMNICMSVAVNPVTGAIAVVGTDATNEVRFEPNVKGKFNRVEIASVNPATLSKTITDLNPHLNYLTFTLPQSERDKSLGDPRAIAWNASGTKAYIAGMGSNNVIVVNASGARAGLHDTIPVAEGPAGLALDEPRGHLYVYNRFAASISVVDTSTETELSRVSFFDPTPTAIKTGRKHLYDTHKNSGLGQIACASCHIDARMDRLAWDLGDPSGSVAPLTDLNLGFNYPGLEPNTTTVPFSPHHPMKGPMLTQTLQDIIGHEPLHWRGDRAGLEAFNPAFVGLQGDDTMLTTQEMQEFENFLATITIPPNPYRNLDNSLPTNLPLPGHYKTGRFGTAGTPLPNGNAVNGFNLYTSGTRRLDNNAFSCVTCHTLPTGGGTDTTRNGNAYTPLAVGSMGQHHIAMVSVDGSTNSAIKIPQLRNEYLKTGFNTTITSNSAGFGVLHDGSVDSIERFVAEPVFLLNSDQEVADMTAFILAFSGGDFPSFAQPPSPIPPQPPGPPSQDTHAAVGKQSTLRDSANPDPGQIALINSMLALADAGKVGVVVKGVQGGRQRGYTYTGSGVFQSDHAGETRTTSQMLAAASLGSELTFTVVPNGSQTRIGIDRNLNGVLDADEIICVADVDNGSGTGTPDGGVTIDDLLYYLGLFNAGDVRADVDDGSSTNTLDGGVTIDDLLYYVLRFNQGC